MTREELRKEYDKVLLNLALFEGYGRPHFKEAIEAFRKQGHLHLAKRMEIQRENTLAYLKEMNDYALELMNELRRRETD